MDFAAEIKIRESLTAKCETVEFLGVILPAPIVFENRAAYFNNVSGLNLTTQKAIETTPIKFCAISILTPFEDENPITNGCEDAPETFLTYNFYVFRQYETTRENESDNFLKRTLKSYNEFLKGIYDLRTEFLGQNKLPGFDADNLIVTSFPLETGDFIEEREPSKLFGRENVFGHQVNLQLRISILPKSD